MKLSLSWIKSHISNSTQLPEPQLIYEMLNAKTTEIESFVPFILDTTGYELVQIKEIIDKTALCWSKEGSEYRLPLRSDGELDQWYLIKDLSAPSWVTVADLGTQKDGLLPMIMPDSFTKKTYHDFILTIDNKAITHRPDLWGHRGFAREIAMLFGLQLIPIEQLTERTAVTQAKSTSAISPEGFSVKKQATACSRVAFCSVECKPAASDFEQARLLSCVDIRPINCIVDSTNYVMADLGQPMHAFDQASFPTKKMIIRMAKEKETLSLLDGTVVTLSNEDLVIANDHEPVSLAGVLGGKRSGIQKKTESIIIEAAHFNGDVIRKTSQRHKKRTDASTRFEKGLDPKNVLIALERFLYLIKPFYKNLSNSFNIQIIGKERKKVVIKIEHATIEHMIGCQLDQTHVMTTLSQLEYTVTVVGKKYAITVPSFRVTDEPTTAADIIEEIARTHGYNRITPEPALIPAISHTNKKSKIIGTVKSFSAFALSLHELNSYAFLDESFIEKISYKPERTLTIKNPVSENWTTLNPSLIPHLLKAVHDNAFDHQKINFFELASTWTCDQEGFKEQLTYAAIWYNQTGEQTFYDGKQQVTALLDLYGIAVTWQQLDKSFWLEPYQSASLVHEGKIIGHAGMISSIIQPHISKHQKSGIFCVEFSFDWYIQSTIKLAYKPISCYQKVHRDVSLFISNTIDFDTLKQEIKPLNTLIEKIELIEFLEKAEWKDQRALTIRITYADQTKTLTKETIDTATNLIREKLKSHGATIR